MKVLLVLLLCGAAVVGYHFWTHRHQPRLAPPDTVYLLDYTSVTTSKGVVGFPPGTAMKIVETRGPFLRLTDGVVNVEVPAVQTTNDLDVAASVAQKDDASQSALAARRQWENKEAVKAMERAEAERQQRTAQQNAGSGVGGRSSALSQPARPVSGGVSGGGGGTLYYSSPSYYRDAAGRQYSYDNFGNRVYR